MFIPLIDIDIGNRIREDYGNDSEWKLFKESFTTFGQRQAIKVEPCDRIIDDNNVEHIKYRLVSGGRRLRAISEINSADLRIPGLPKEMIEATIDDEVPTRVKMMREFAENKQRKDFTVQEQAKYISNFHEQMLKESNGAWTQDLTAYTLKLSPFTISTYLRVNKEIDTNETVAKASTLRSAMKRVRIQDEIKERINAAVSSNDDSFKRATGILSHADAREWIRGLEDSSVDFINFDPPWGDDVSHKSAENHEAFDDSSEYADTLMRDLFPQLYRVLRENRFCVFWHRMWASERMAELAISFGFNLTHTRTPAIWFKPEKLTDQNRDPEKRLIEAYEPFYLLRKGDPVFYEKFANNVFPFPRVPLGQLIHPTEKPPDLCDAIIKLTTVPGETVLDPTSGSSAWPDRAIRLKRKAKACEKSEHYYQKGLIRLGDYLKTFSEV